MEEGMDARTAKMKAVSMLLIVEILELLHKLDEARMGLLEVGSDNCSICNNSDATHEFAEILPIFVRQNGTEKAWP
jgi:hypothetical protein